MQSTKERVLITGATGFLGNHLCKTFLEDGTYTVRGTTTNLKNTKRIDGLKQACGKHFASENFELVEADLKDFK